MIASYEVIRRMSVDMLRVRICGAWANGSGATWTRGWPGAGQKATAPGETAPVKP